MLKPILWFVGIWAVLLIVMEVTLSQSVLTGLVNKYATEYIDGDLRFGKVSISMFRRFPNVSVSLEDFSITYPADRFDSQENEGLRSYLVHKGCGQESDTLASFRKFTAAVNVPALITGNVRVPYVRLDRPRIFAHSYADGSTNWNMFGAPDTDSPDESAGSVEDVQDEMPDSTVSEVSVPKLSIGRIRMSQALTGYRIRYKVRVEPLLIKIPLAKQYGSEELLQVDEWNTFTGEVMREY